MEAITLREKHPSLWLKQNHEEDTPLPSCYSLVQQWRGLEAKGDAM
jgi:hypothetical protein